LKISSHVVIAIVNRESRRAVPCIKCLSSCWTKESVLGPLPAAIYVRPQDMQSAPL